MLGRAVDGAVVVAALAAGPGLVRVLPRARAALIHAFHAFPGLELKVLARMAAMGRKARLTRAGT
jgi:hypothetical protein